jgi:hypothetical protein
MSINNKMDAYAMNNYFYNLTKGFYGEDKKTLSEKYFLMAIEKGNISSIQNYADYLVEELYGEEKRFR